MKRSIFYTFHRAKHLRDSNAIKHGHFCIILDDKTSDYTDFLKELLVCSVSSSILPNVSEIVGCVCFTSWRRFTLFWEKIALHNLKLTVLFMILVSQTPNQPSQWNHCTGTVVFLTGTKEWACRWKQTAQEERARLQLNHGYLEHHQLGPDVCLLRFRTASICQTNTAGICYNSGNRLFPSDRGYISAYQYWISEVISLPWSLLSWLLTDGCCPSVRFFA